MGSEHKQDQTEPLRPEEGYRHDVDLRFVTPRWLGRMYFDLRIGRDVRGETRPLALPRSVRRRNGYAIAVLGQMAVSWVVAVVLLVAYVSQVGCGANLGGLPTDGSQAGGLAGRTGALAVAVSFPEVSTRLIPRSTRSVVITVTSPDTMAVAVTAVLTPASPSTRLDGLITGASYRVEAQAMPLVDGGGTPVATGCADVVVPDGGTAEVAISLDSTVSRVTVTGAASPVLGETKQLTATAWDASDRVILVGGAWEWTSSDPAVATVSDAGVVCATAVGRTTIAASATEAGVSGSLVVTVLAADATRTAAAGSNISWHVAGPGGGGWIASLACDPLDPRRLYAGCDVGGLYVSDDGGASWRISNSGLMDFYVQSIAIAPDDPGTIILGTEGGIYKSTDAGASWQLKRDGFPPVASYSFSAPVSVVQFSRSDPRVVYAGIGRPRWSTGGTGSIYRSEDRGESWALLTPSGVLPPTSIVWDIAVSADGAYTLVATDQGLYRSGRSDRAWRKVSAGLPHDQLRQVKIAYRDSLVAYCTMSTVARGAAGWDGGVYKSVDGGQSWTPCSEGLGHRVGAVGDPYQASSTYATLVVDPRNDEVVYVGDLCWWTAGVYKTSNGGASWSKLTGVAPLDWQGNGLNVRSLAVSPADPSVVVFGTEMSVYTSETSGASWQPRTFTTSGGALTTTGLETTVMFKIVPDPSIARRVYFCYWDIGLLVSEDGGQTFRRLNGGMAVWTNCFTVAVDPSDSSTLWAAMGSSGSTNSSVLYRSVDAGATWTQVGSGLPRSQVREIIVDPATAEGSRGLYAIARGQGVYRSSDGGATWVAAFSGLPCLDVRGLVLDPARQGHLMAALGGAASGGSVCETVDGGRSWNLVSSNGARFKDVQALAVGPGDFATLYIGAKEYWDSSAGRLLPGGLYRSRDGGTTWTLATSAYREVACVAVSPTNGSVVYAGTSDDPSKDMNRPLGVLRSDDGGDSWTVETQGVSQTNLKVKTLAIDPHDPSVLYAGTAGNGGMVGSDAHP